VKLARATQATARGVQKSLGSPPHWALALVALGPLHTPSELAELGGETAQLQSVQRAALAGRRGRLGDFVTV